jgi:hypothetical protein
VNVNEVLHGGNNNEGDLNSILFNSAASTVSKWRAFKLLRRAHVLNRLMDLDEILYGGDGI